MQIVPLLGECGLSAMVDKELQCSSALRVYLCMPAGTLQLSKLFLALSVVDVFPMSEQCGSVVVDAGLAAAA